VIPAFLIVFITKVGTGFSGTERDSSPSGVKFEIWCNLNLKSHYTEMTSKIFFIPGTRPMVTLLGGRHTGSAEPGVSSLQT